MNFQFAVRRLRVYNSGKRTMFCPSLNLKRMRYSEEISEEVNMPLTSIEAIFDGKRVRLLEPPPIRQQYRVLVTFLEPEPEPAPAAQERFWSSFGAWVDDRPVEATLQDIYASRKSKVEPPSL